MLKMIFLLISIVSAFVIAGLSVDIIKKRDVYSGCIFLAYACLCSVIISICCASYFSSKDAEAILLWHNLKYFGFNIFPVMVFLFSISFNIESFEIDKKTVTYFLILPIVISVLKLTNEYHHLIYSEIDVINTFSINSVKYKSTNIEILMNIYSLSLIFTSLLIYIYKIRDYSGKEKQKYASFIIGIFITMLSYIIEFFNTFENVEVSFITTVMALLFLYKGLMVYSSDNFIRLAKNTVFEKNSNVALVLNAEGKIVEYNPTAKSLFSFMQMEIEDADFEFLIKKWLRESNGYVDSSDNGKMISVKKLGKRYYYQMIQSKIKDNLLNDVGTYVEMRDITLQQESIYELFKLVNTDQLTGLFNRRYFDTMCSKLNRENYFPIAVISGDLNRLKHTNDTYGHAYGDRLIILISEIMKQAAPKKAVICRHGGDEFSVLMANSSEAEIQNFIRKVDAICSRSGEEPFGIPSISLGYALKNDKETPMKDVIDMADKMMYEVKERKHKIGDMFKRS